MTRWPEDHPGRRCNKCGLNIYSMWVDAEVPPPGKCPDNAMRPEGCPSFIARMVTSAQVWEAIGKAPAPETIALLERAGLDEEWARLQGARFRAYHEALDALGILNTAPITISGKSIRDWCAGEFSVERIAAILSHVKGEFDPWRGQEPGELSMLALGEEQERAESLSASGWPEWEPE